MNEDNQYDHLETVNIYLNCPEISFKPSVQNFAASPAIAPKALNHPSKARSYNNLYEGLSEANKRAIAALELSVSTDTATVLEQLLFAQVAGRVIETTDQVAVN